ncbi:50S ribosomal protein L9 [Candidatus Tisiphia endosymbiont of Nemotelus uliginosus]|uniref:50S ribosomal protein L9 n=1 Tax=Candidatus Tisiphia endosymbiont of Nemotelus uliginosus TaxID=3077926 RepID=UPI0035C8E73E
MEVILVKPVRHLGKIAEICEVKNGFARNYLFPNKLAIRATVHNKQIIADQKYELEIKDDKSRTEASIISNNINGKEIMFIRQSAEDGRLFGSVNSKEIAEALSKISDHPIAYSNIVLDKPIKTTGVFVVEVRLHAELSSNITVIVARTESEAQDYSRDNRQFDEDATKHSV